LIGDLTQPSEAKGLTEKKRDIAALKALRHPKTNLSAIAKTRSV
jgi:hypothetical protein